MSTLRDYEVFQDKPSLSRALSSIIKESSRMAIDSKGSFNIAVSGGSLLDLLNLSEILDDLTKWQVFLVDERFVPLYHPDSNYDGLMGRFGRLLVNVHPVNTAVNLDQARQLYEDELGKAGNLDLCLLGMGPDGHTASLFPELFDPSSPNIVDAVQDAPKPPPTRLTLSLPFINRSDRIVFVVTGREKAEVIGEIFLQEHCELPAALVRQQNCRWLLDNLAASRLY